MTAGRSPVELLDTLDALRAEATPGPWRVAPSGAIDAGDYDTVIGPGDVNCMSRCYGGTSTIEGDNLTADAACIIAAVNHLPALVAALRAVLGLAAEMDLHRRTYPARGLYADRLRAAVTAALTEGGQAE